MGRIVWRIVVVLSISLNLAFIGSILFPGSTDGERGAQLKLSQQQKQQVMQIQQTIHKKNEVIKKKIGSCQKDLLAALNQEKIDKDKINECIEDISAMQKEIQLNAVDQIVQMRRHLDKDQCDCLMEELHAKMAQENRPCDKACCRPEEK